mgnify:CR=1 FL=1|tara:strand:+ start:81 stop:311 length:231 start_codon:yes stop_codon:yes gene_type:complete
MSEVYKIYQEPELIDNLYAKAQQLANKLSDNVAICLVDVGDSTEIKYYAESDLDFPEYHDFILHIYDIVSYELGGE